MDWFACGTDILRDLRTRAFSRAIGRSRPETVGHLVGVYSLLARAGNESGDLTEIDDDTLEDEAMWKGKAGVFASAFRAHYVDADGHLRNWNRWNGKAIGRAKRERDRIREYRNARRAEREQAAQSAADGTQARTRTERVQNGNGTGRQDSTEQDSTTTRTRESPDGDRGGWVAEAVRRWAVHIGVVPYGRMGKALKPAVALYGEAAVLAAIDKFGEWRARRDASPTGERPGLPQFVATVRTHIPPPLLPAHLRAAQEAS